MPCKAGNCLNCYLLLGFALFFLLFFYLATLSLKRNVEAEVVQESFSQECFKCWYIVGWGWFRGKKCGTAPLWRLSFVTMMGIVQRHLTSYCLIAEKVVMPPDSLLGCSKGRLSWQLRVWCENFQMWHGKMQDDSSLSIVIQIRFVSSLWKTNPLLTFSKTGSMMRGACSSPSSTILAASSQGRFFPVTPKASLWKHSA